MTEPLYVGDILAASPDQARVITSMQQWNGAMVTLALDQVEFWVTATATHCLRHADGLTKFLADNPDYEFTTTSYERWFEPENDLWWIKVETTAMPKTRLYPPVRKKGILERLADRVMDWVTKGLARWE